MKTLSNEVKVGSLVLGTGILAVAFAWALGIQNPFRQTREIFVTYHFAGGIEIGSPVRVSGVKVGKVEAIEFFAKPTQPTKPTSLQEPGSADTDPQLEPTPVKLKISILEKAAVGVRSDSRFYINMAGIIGERYIEITPGKSSSPMLKHGDVVAGVDPPRIDQLISQSFDLAGKIVELVDENKEGLSRSIELLYKLSKNLNQTLKWVDQSKLFQSDIGKLIDNLIDVTSHVKKVTGKVETPEGKKTLDLMYRLLWRLEPLDSQTVRQFLQKEGVKVQLF